jgi:hypothetical protein
MLTEWQAYYNLKDKKTRQAMKEAEMKAKNDKKKFK